MEINNKINWSAINVSKAIDGYKMATLAPPIENKNGGQQYALSLPWFYGTPNVCVL